jgi:hypothetical protein
MSQRHLDAGLTGGTTMNPGKRFLIGGVGALMPILVTLLAVDLGAIFAQHSSVTAANVVGVLVRYVILFVIGGFVAYLHEDERKPFKLFEIGIAAPALITSLVTSQAIAPATPPPGAGAESPTTSWQWTATAYAAETEQSAAPAPILLAGFLQDVLDGASGRVYRDLRRPPSPVEPSPNEHPAATPPPSAPVGTVPHPGPAGEPSPEEAPPTASRGLDTEHAAPPHAEREMRRSEAPSEVSPAAEQAARARAAAARAEAERLKREYEAALERARRAEHEAASDAP